MKRRQKSLSDSFYTIEDNLRYLLTKHPHLKDAKNEQVVKMYRHHIFMGGTPSSESITRTLRKIKEKSPEEFGSKQEAIQAKKEQTKKILEYVKETIYN